MAKTSDPKDKVKDAIEESKAALEESKDAKDGSDDEDGGSGLPGTPGNKRRFFPRVKHLLTREWEFFLSGVLDATEKSGAPTAAAASHKATNPWYIAFDLVYGGVASDCSIPSGKNRFHKFKDKIVELWLAMEQQAPDDHPLKPKATDQLAEYRKACDIANKKETTKPTPKGITNLSISERGGSAAIMHKRKYTTGAQKWKHLDEDAALKKLPEPLQSLVNLRHLGSELGKRPEGVESQYQKALEEYCQKSAEGKDELYDKSLALAALHRQAEDAKEAKEISAAYEKAVADYLVHIDPTAAVV